MPKLAKPQAQPLSDRPLFDELNLGRLSLISMRTRVGSADYTWVEVFTEGDRMVTIRCLGVPQYLAPHGLDNDVMVGIQNMFLEAGNPADNKVRAPARAYLRASGLDVSGRYYESLKDSLMRLNATTYEVERGWRGGDVWETVTLRHLERVRYLSRKRGTVLEDTMIEVQLPDHIADSLRRGFIRPINFAVLSQLRQPSSRALYRLLDAIRHDPLDPQRRVPAYSVGIVEWASKARLFSDEPDKIRRSLEPAHKELLSTRYLSEVQYSGRGKSQTVTYVFAPDVDTVDPVLFDQLVGLGVVRKVARDLIDEFGGVTVRERLDRVLLKIQGSKSKLGPGFIVKYIRNPADYEGRTIEASPESSASRSPTSKQPVLFEQADPDKAEEARWQSMTKAQRIRDVLGTLKVILKDYLTRDETARLQDAMEVGALDPEGIKSTASQWSSHEGRTQLAASLKAILGELER